MDTVFVVQAYVTKQDSTERKRRILYAGTNAKDALEYLGWGAEAEVTIDLWTDGENIHTITQ